MKTTEEKYITAEPYETLDSGHHEMIQDLVHELSDSDIRKVFNAKKQEQDSFYFPPIDKPNDKKMIYYVPFKSWQANYVNEKSSHDSFEDAFRWLFKKMKENPPTSYQTPYQTLETMIWIVEENKPRETFMDFYHARDHAYQRGIIKDGQLIGQLI